MRAINSQTALLIDNELRSVQTASAVFPYYVPEYDLSQLDLAY